MKLHVPIAAGFILAGCAGAANAAAPARTPAERGLQLAERNCSVCHAIGTPGESPNAKAPPFRQIYRRYPAESLDEAFRKGLLTRHPAMPEMRFLPSEIEDLTAFFRTLRGKGETEARGATVQRAVFAR